MMYRRLGAVPDATCGEPWIGMPLGQVDVAGNPLYIGDKMEFDAEEWGGPAFFVIDFINGQVEGRGNEHSEWCTLRKPYPQRKL